jgi:hypothetical protein
MNIHRLQPIQDFAHFAQGGQVFGPFGSAAISQRPLDNDPVDGFAKGGKIRKQKQKQSQRQTQIVNIHTTAPRRRKRRAAPKSNVVRNQPIQLPPQFTSVPSGYIHRPEPTPQAIHPQLMSRLDEIEERMRNSLFNQMPHSLGQDEILVDEAPISNIVKNQGKEEAQEIINQIPLDMPQSSAEATSTLSAAASSSSSHKSIPWQGVNVYVAPNGTLKYTLNKAGDEKDEYISKFVGTNKTRLGALSELYSKLDKSGLRYKKVITIQGP